MLLLLSLRSSDWLIAMLLLHAWSVTMLFYLSLRSHATSSWSDVAQGRTNCTGSSLITISVVCTFLLVPTAVSCCNRSSTEARLQIHILVATRGWLLELTSWLVLLWELLFRRRFTHSVLRSWLPRSHAFEARWSHRSTTTTIDSESSTLILRSWWHAHPFLVWLPLVFHDRSIALCTFIFCLEQAILLFEMPLARTGYKLLIQASTSRWLILNLRCKCIICHGVTHFADKTIWK